MEHFVVKRVPLVARPAQVVQVLAQGVSRLDRQSGLTFDGVEVKLRLRVQDLVQSIWIEEQFQQRPQQAADEAHRPPM